MPQPYFVPVNPICSRRTQSSGVSGSTSTSNCFPLTLSFAMGQRPPLGGACFRCARPRRRSPRAPELIRLSSLLAEYGLATAFGGKRLMENLLLSPREIEKADFVDVFDET